MSSTENIRAAWRQIVVDQRPTVEVMLGMGLETSAEGLNRDAAEFCNRIQRRAHGPRWYKVRPEAQLWAVGFHEHPGSNRHLHCAIRGTSRIEDRLVLDGCKIWKALRPAGDYHVDRIHDLERYASYITKDAWTNASQETVFLYQPKSRRNR